MKLNLTKLIILFAFLSLSRVNSFSASQSGTGVVKNTISDVDELRQIIEQKQTPKLTYLEDEPVEVFLKVNMSCHSKRCTRNCSFCEGKCGIVCRFERSKCDKCVDQCTDMCTSTYKSLPIRRGFLAFKKGKRLLIV